MKVCPNKKCGATDIASDVRYCPHCGQRFPFAKDVKVIESNYWKTLKKKAQPSPGKTLVNKDEYNRVLNSYQNMINNGYTSPLSGNEVISDAELQQLRKNATELNRWKRECENRRKTPIYDYKDEYTNDFYWGNALLGTAALGVVIFWLFFAIPTIWGWIFGSDKVKTGVEIVLNEKTGKYGIMNHRLDSLVTPYSYDTIIYRNRNDYNYYQLVQKETGKLGIADSAGYRTICAELDSVKELGYNLSVIYKEGCQGIISHVGQHVFDARFYRVLWLKEPYSSSYTDMEIPGRYIGNIIPVQATQNSDWELYNRSGEKITYRQYQYVSQVCHPDVIKVATSYNKWGLIDSNGKTVLPCEYYYLYMFKEDKAWVRKSYSKSDKWICISPSGKNLGTLSNDYRPLGGFSSGLSPVSYYNKSERKSYIGYCNQKGEIVIPAKYDYYFSPSGRVVWPSPSFTGDSALVSSKGKNGILWKDGTFKEKE